MPTLYMNRKDESDIVVSGRYQVAKDKQVRLGYPLKEAGSIGGGANPVYTKYRAVEEYDDATSAEICIGVSEDQIPSYDTIEASELKDIEWRHFRRDVAVCQFGVRKMINKDVAAAKTGADIMPVPGGFKIWTSGKQKIGKVHQGPIAADAEGEVLIMIANTQT